MICPKASKAELEQLREQIIADPRAWIAQPVVQLSTVPTVVGRELGARHVDLRPFAVNNGDRVTVLPGGLTRVALQEGQLIVNSSQGGGSKDTWVLTDEGAATVARGQRLAPRSQQYQGPSGQSQTMGTMTQSQGQVN